MSSAGCIPHHVACRGPRRTRDDDDDHDDLLIPIISNQKDNEVKLKLLFRGRLSHETMPMMNVSFLT